MLQLIRDRSQGLVVGVIVFFICLTFALFGVQEYLEARSTVVVAEVNGEEVGLEEYQRSFQQMRRRAQAMLGERFDPDEWADGEVKLAALDFVVSKRLLLQTADKANLRISDNQTANHIRTSPQFQQDGVFSRDFYQQMVRALGFSELGFEHRVRKDLVINQLRAGIGASAITTTEELQRLEQYRQQTRDTGFAILGIEAFRNGLAPSRTEIEAYFAENAERYRIEEQVSLAFLELSIESLMADVFVDEDTLKAYYEANQDNYTVQEQRNVNHILVTVSRSATESEVEAARERVEGLHELTLNTDSFEDIAKENSDDLGSRSSGGETGFFERGIMAPEFEETVFAMSEHEISQPIRTDFGFHIIRLKEIKPSGTKDYGDARAEIEAVYRRDQAEAVFFEQAEQLSELVYEQPNSLDGAATMLGLSVKTTELLTRSQLVTRFSTKVATATFATEVLTEGLNSEPIELSNTQKIIVVRVVEHIDSSLPRVDDVLAAATQDLIDIAAREAVHTAGKDLVERLNNDEDLESVLGSADLKWEKVTGATRDSAKINRAMLRAAFSAEPGKPDEVVYIGVPIGTGDYGIVGVSNVVMPLAEQLNTSDINELRRGVAATRTTTDWMDFVALLKSDSNIESFPDRL